MLPITLIMIKCPGCGGVQFWRSRRRGLGENILARVGYWPYRCLECSERFRLRMRNHVPQTATPKPETKAEMKPDDVGPEVASHRHPHQPVAKVVIQADSHEQLDQVLLALQRAVARYDTSSNRTHADYAKRR
jgi:hypothetical protein